MHQPSLFDAVEAGDNHLPVRFYPAFSSWWDSALDAVARGVAPDRIWWRVDRTAQRTTHDSQIASKHKAFAEQARCATCHSAEDRFALMYSILWRIHHNEPHLMELSADPHVVRLLNYAKAVRRDRHKMKAFVRFRAVEDGQTEPRYVAWFEPDHNIVELTAPFFTRRFTNMRWSILTPDQCAHWEGEGKLWFSAGVDKSAAPAGDQFEEAWRVYYKSIFNPARLKVNAMRSEMPQKYWKNLPEAHLIPELIRGADARVERMKQQHKESDVLQCGERPISPSALLQQQQAAAPAGSLQSLALAAQACRDCSLWEAATQVVFGEGPENAQVMLVGEQPGDAEDLAGKPFVGPAGKLLNRALQDAGLRRESLYLTNAVKHFGYVARGRRRMHSKPTIESVHACMSWLTREISSVDPAFIVCLGATAAQAVLGAAIDVSRQRGKIVQHGSRRVLVTVHPAQLLRSGADKGATRPYKTFVSELRLVADALLSIDSSDARR